MELYFQMYLKSYKMEHELSIFLQQSPSSHPSFLSTLLCTLIQWVWLVSLSNTGLISAHRFKSNALQEASSVMVLQVWCLAPYRCLSASTHLSQIIGSLRFWKTCLHADEVNQQFDSGVVKRHIQNVEDTRQAWFAVTDWPTGCLFHGSKILVISDNLFPPNSPDCNVFHQSRVYNTLLRTGVPSVLKCLQHSVLIPYTF